MQRHDEKCLELYKQRSGHAFAGLEWRGAVHRYAIWVNAQKVVS
jgi:hypothetical protein